MITHETNAAFDHRQIVVSRRPRIGFGNQIVLVIFFSFVLPWLILIVPVVVGTIWHAAFS